MNCFCIEFSFNLILRKLKMEWTYASSTGLDGGLFWCSLSGNKHLQEGYLEWFWRYVESNVSGVEWWTESMDLKLEGAEKRMQVICKRWVKIWYDHGATSLDFFFYFIFFPLQNCASSDAHLRNWLVEFP